MGGYHFRASPSAGALYPVETYLAVHQVEGVTPGIWHFQVLDFALELVAAGDFRQPWWRPGSPKVSWPRRGRCLSGPEY